MNKGFTLVELIAVIVILGLLVVITTPAYDTINRNIRTRNYQSKQSAIASETLSYVEKYLKDEVYDGTNQNHNLCFSINYLIQNGIISSDSEKDEYILNEVTNKRFEGNDIYIEISYDTNDLKLKAKMPDMNDYIDTSSCSTTH